MTGPDTGADPDARWGAVRSLVDGALELPAAARACYLAGATSDPAVHAEAARWLDACERAAAASDFLAHPAAERAAPLLDAADAAGDRPPPDAATDLAALRRGLAHAWEIEREVGRGGMATVYLARDPRHQRRVAVKVLHPVLSAALGAERFLREIEVTAGLQHPHVLPLFDSGSVGGRPYYVMPYVDGETLRERLARTGRLTVADAIRLVREVASALDHAHRRGVVHRDVKPANILLADGHAVVADFGIARAVRRARSSGIGDASDSSAGVASGAADGAPPDGPLTDAGTSPGTPGYMAPEQARGEADVDHRADVYALGVVAYEAITGVHPSRTRDPHGEPSVDPRWTVDVPPALAALVTRMLAADPAARPPSAAAVIDALDALPDAHIGAARPRGPASRRSAPPRRAALVVAALVACAALAAGGRALRQQAAPAVARMAAVRAVRGVAVLPFTNVGGVSGDDYLGDGLRDELARALARHPGVRVAGTASSRAFGAGARSLPAIGRALGVDALVEGTVRHVGDRVRVTARLVTAASGAVRWDSVYDTRARDLFAVQDDLTRAIVAALPRDPAAARRATSAIDLHRGTADQEAYDLYLRGRYLWMQRGGENIAHAIAYFGQAIARDPAFARAHAGLAMAYGTLPGFVPDPTDSATTLAEASARRAVALDPTLVEGQLALATSLDMRLHLTDALPRYRAAVALDPSSVTGHHWLGMSLLNLGRTDEAIVELRHATELDPLAPTPASAFAIALVHARRYSEARVAARRALALDSTFVLALWPLGLAQAFGGQPDSAVRTFERGVRLQPADTRMSTGLTLAYAAVGRWRDAARVGGRLHPPAGDRSGWGDEAVAALVFGDRAPILRLLTTEATQRRYVAEGALLGCNPLLDPLWREPRFRAAMHALGVRPCALARPWPVRPRRLA